LPNSDLKEELSYELSEDQEKIATGVKEAFINHKNSLIYAVCGAGKTELVYRTIAYALSVGLQVGFTIPRKDVVIELEERIKSAFPNNSVVSVYGGHTSILEADIIILTCHQLYRYEKYFDLLIIDETDAFPYQGNDVLHTFFKKSIKGNYIMMSATPLKSMIQEIKECNGRYFELKTRYHGHPLIVPKVVIAPFFRSLLISRKLYDFIRHNKQCFIFEPTIDQAEILYKQLKVFFKQGQVVHSKKKDRDQIISDFKKGKYNYLVTTSVLERGVTVKNLQVIVDDASSPIYDDKTLIQISGRVGRKIDAWDGEVIFYADKRNSSIDTAIKKIEEANSYVKNM
jgi:competence protein ComFA